MTAGFTLLPDAEDDRPFRDLPIPLYRDPRQMEHIHILQAQ